MRKDSVQGTLVIAGILCVCCSILVAGAAVMLKPKQLANKELDIKKNMLLASGLIEADALDRENVLKVYQRVRKKIVDLESGEYFEKAPEAFDQRKAAKDPEQSIVIPKQVDIAGIKRRSKKAEVFEVYNGSQLEMYIFPIHGKGLWSTLYGFVALTPDFSKVLGLGFYEHAETPGLGGEVDNPNWKALWVGKKVFDENLVPQISVIKGTVSSTDPRKDFKVDGLSGATITANGVTNLIRYWLGEDGFGPFIKNRLAKGEQNEKY